MEESVVDRIVAIIKNQQQKGLNKYGKTVDDANLTPAEWVDHACEELADMMIYLQKLKQTI